LCSSSLLFREYSVSSLVFLVLRSFPTRRSSDLAEDGYEVPAGDRVLAEEHDLERDPRAPSGTVVGGELDDAVGLAVGHARADLHHLAVYLPVGRVHRHVLAGPQVAAGPQLDSSQVVVVGVDRPGGMGALGDVVGDQDRAVLGGPLDEGGLAAA